jgi:hypothetical protein
MDLTVREMSQHVYQHPGEPRDLDYRVNALNAALQREARSDATPAEVVQAAGVFEAYLRGGTA